jgi:hypothetical protein
LLTAFAAAAAAGGTLDLLPTPHYLEMQGAALRFSAAEPVHVLLAHANLEAASEALANGFPDARFARGDPPQVVLWDYSVSQDVRVPLNFLDRQLLADSALRSQSYVLRTHGSSLFVVGGGAAGVLYGAATAAQLIRKNGGGLEIPGIYIRDYPDFEYRAASDWLLNTEINRWALDRGRGLEDYSRLVKKKLDRAARFKINVVLIDGFGWSFDKRPAGYAAMMRELNRYARARGIRLQYGGYGAAYDTAQQPGEFHGMLFLNRESYPEGREYECLAYPPRTGGINPRTMGGCRSNDELNRLKAEELEHFVNAVEPGMLYIHHEDCCVFEDMQKAWLGRCERCRRRWPNDSLLAADGGAGGLAHGYSNLIAAATRVSHKDTGFNAAKDTQIVLVSPVYMPASPRSEQWGEVLELWRNIARLLPRTSNVQICFREVLPQPGGGKRFIELFNSIMAAEGLPFGAYVFMVGGADNFLTDYPTTGTPAMNAYFRGARTMYNATGDFYREPMELLSAEYSWNIRSDGFFLDPENEAQIAGVDQWIYKPAAPAEIFGPGKLFDRICARLYGSRAGEFMSRYYRLAAPLPDVDIPEAPPDRAWYRGRKTRYLPRVWTYATAVPSYWYHLLLDSLTWGPEPEERYRSGMRGLDISKTELHRRLARRWKLASELNAAGAQQIHSAIAAGPLPDSVEDLRFLESLFRIYAPLLAGLRDYHQARADPPGSEVASLLRSSLHGAETVQRLAEQQFPNPVDPAMGEVRSLVTYPGQLADAIRKWQASR